MIKCVLWSYIHVHVQTVANKKFYGPIVCDMSLYKQLAAKGINIYTCRCTCTCMYTYMTTCT